MSTCIRCYIAALQKIQSKCRDCERRQKMDQSVLDTIDPRVLGDDLQKARKRRGLTQEDAAKIIETARTTLVAIEKGERRIKPGELIKKTIGLRKRRYSSIKPRWINVWVNLGLPKIMRSRPGCCLSDAISSAIWSFTSREFFHSARESVVENTIFETFSTQRACSRSRGEASGSVSTVGQ